MKIELERSVANEFNHIRVSRQDGVVRGHFPDFMIVGPQRTGTTWLATNLRHHPEIFLSFPKELYFFNRLAEAKSSHSLHYERLNRGVWRKGLGSMIRQLIKIGYMDFYRTGRRNANELEWYLKFFEEDDWGVSLVKRMVGEQTDLPGEVPKVRGEATASYAVLEHGVIQDIVRLNPDIKIVLMIRDPVERAWSHAKKDLVRDGVRSFKEIASEDFIEYLSSPYMIKCGTYTAAIENWKAYLKPDHLFVGMYDELRSAPAELLLRLYDFLGVEVNERYISQRVQNVINKTNEIEIPAECRTYLEDIYQEERSRLKSQYHIDFQ